MNPKIRLLVEADAMAKGIAIDPNFYVRADQYIQKHFPYSPERDKLVIEGYLAQAALRIARSEGKARLEGEDFKAAVWLFHQPDQPDDPCIRAGQAALQREGLRVKASRGLLTEAFAKRLDIDLGK